MAFQLDLAIGLALAFGIINVMWPEANDAFGICDEGQTRERFEKSRQINKEARLQRRTTDREN